MRDRPPVIDYVTEGANMTSRDDLTRTILQIIGETLAAKDLSTQGLGLDSRVDSTLGLDSLDWAAVVVRIELETGLDPFPEGTIGRSKTVSDLDRSLCEGGSLISGDPGNVG